MKKYKPKGLMIKTFKVNKSLLNDDLYRAAFRPRIKQEDKLYRLMDGTIDNE